MQSKRIEYIDAMRGFAIFLVVLGHVSGFILTRGWKADMILESYLTHFHMPLFFLISGFVLYKSDYEWTFKKSLSFLTQKVSFLLVSPFLFLLAYLSITGTPLDVALQDTYKKGYWFTFTLFQFYFAFMLLQWCTKLMRMKDIINDTFLILSAFLIYAVIVHYNGWQDWYCIGVPHWTHFLFFISGYLIRKHFTTFERILDSRYFLAVCVILYFGFRFIPELSVISSLGYGLVLLLTAVLLVFALFRKHQQVFSKQHAIGRAMQFVGQRTLDIYLIHYFFLVTNMQAALPNFAELNSPFIELVLAVLITVLIISASLLMSAVLRVSPLLAHYLFGQKL